MLGTAAMPTQNGEAPGKTSMSGGWVLSVGSHAKDKKAAFDLVALSLNKENALAYDIAASQIAERKDVAEDQRYLSSNPTLKFFTVAANVTSPMSALMSDVPSSRAARNASSTPPLKNLLAAGKPPT